MNDKRWWIPNIKVTLDELVDQITEYNDFQQFMNAFRTLRSRLLEPPQVMIIGSFSTGKSTFLNSLFGKEIADMGALPTTAITTKLSYGNEDRVFVHFKNGDIIEYSISDFKKLTSEKSTDWINLHDSIEYVERLMPEELLQQFSIIDSPGLDAKSDHTARTKTFLNCADVILWMVSAENAISASELVGIKALESRYKPIIIVNKIDTLDEEEDNLADLIDSIQHKLGNLVDCIYPISAKMALMGRQSDEEKLIESSNILELENHLQSKVVFDAEIHQMNAFINGFSSLVFFFLIQLDISYNKNLNKFLRNRILKSIQSICTWLDEYCKRIIQCDLSFKDFYYAAKDAINLELAGKSWLDYSKDELFHKMLEHLESAAMSGQYFAELIMLWIEDNSDNNIVITKCLADNIENQYRDNPNYLSDYLSSYILGVDLIEVQGLLEVILAFRYKYKDEDADEGIFLSYIKLAWEHRNIRAALELALFYKDKGNTKQSISILKILADMEDIGDISFIAQNELGVIYTQGLGNVGCNPINAEKYLVLASRSGKKEYYYNLVRFYLITGNIPAFKKCIPKLENEWQLGDHEAGIVLANFYWNNDILRAFSYIEVLANQDDISDDTSWAQNKMGIIYRDGLCNHTKDLDLAEQWLSKAAQSSNANYIYDLAKLRLMMGNKNDYMMGISRIESAWRAGDIVAAEPLIEYYWENKFFDKVASCLEYVAHQYIRTESVILAQDKLAIMYLKGLGNINKDFNKAIFWAEKSYEYGEIKAAKTLAMAYRKLENTKLETYYLNRIIKRFEFDFMFFWAVWHLVCNIMKWISADGDDCLKKK